MAQVINLLIKQVSGKWQFINEPLPAEITLNGDSDMKAISLDNTHVIAIEFPLFVDGRGYSQARLLREQYHYKGELRAIGNVLYDQLYYMLRCGFDSFELNAGRIERLSERESVIKAFTEISLAYQSTADNAANIRQLRFGLEVSGAGSN